MAGTATPTNTRQDHTWAQDLQEQMRTLIAGVIRQFADCDIWGVPAADTIENEPA